MKGLNYKDIALSLILPLIIVTPIGYFILTPPSPFNFIPFALHYSIFSGTGIKESTFIIAFDLMVLAILFLLFNRMVRKKLKE
jgi:hypothetical protein